MINKKFLVCIVFVIAAALAWTVFIITENNKSFVSDVPAVTEKIEDILPPRTEGTVGERTKNEMPVMNIDGNDYSGIIGVPGKNVKMPVYSGWDEKAAKSVPCRYSGSMYDLTLMIGGSESGGFDFLTRLEKGETVTFTDMTGKVYTFRVDSIVHRRNFDIKNDGDLVLFSYMSDVSRYIFVRCR